MEKLAYHLSYNHTSTDGFSAAYDSIGTKAFDKDGLKQNSFLANLGYQLSPALNIGLTSNYSKYKAATDVGAYTDDCDASATSENFANSITIHYKKQKTNIRFVQSIIQSNRFYLDDSTDKGTLRLNPQATFYNKWSLDKYKAQSLVTELYGNHSFSKHASFIAGVQYIHQKTDQSYKSISNFGPYNAVPVGSDTAYTNHFSGYASILFTDLSGFNVEPGGRANHHSVYGSNATFTFNPSYKISNQASVFMNIYSGYNIPSLYQLYSEYGNKKLKPETSINYEIGVHSFTNDNKNSFRIVAFKRDVKDLIIFTTDPVSFTSKYINQNQQNDYGFEVESNMALARWGQWVSNFTYIAGEGIANGVKTSNLFRRPNFVVNSALTLQPTKELTVIPTFRYIGERKPGGYDIGPNPMKPYYTIDFYTAYAIKQKVKLFIDLRSITDQKYFDIYGYNSRRFNFMAGIIASL